MSKTPEEKPGFTVSLTPRINWSALHGELTQALHDELRHVLAMLLRRRCPVCDEHDTVDAGR